MIISIIILFHNSIFISTPSLPVTFSCIWIIHQLWHQSNTTYTMQPCTTLPGLYVNLLLIHGWAYPRCLYANWLIRNCYRITLYYLCCIVYFILWQFEINKIDWLKSYGQYMSAANVKWCHVPFCTYSWTTKWVTLRNVR